MAGPAWAEPVAVRIDCRRPQAPIPSEGRASGHVSSRHLALPQPPRPRPTAPAVTTTDPAAFTAIVGQDGQAEHRTIASAIGVAQGGARILIRAGTYPEHLRVERDVELVADGPPGSVKVVAPDTCLAIVGGSVTVRGVTFWQGQPKASGMTRLLGRSNQNEPVIAAKVEPQFAAVQINAGTLTLEDCSISAASGLAIGTGRSGTRIEIRRTRIHRVTGGIAVLGGATGLIEDCEFSEWALDAIWASRAWAVEVRGCRFKSSPGQAIYADKAATAIVEGCDFEDVGVAVFVGDAETEALVRSSTARGCEKAALLVGGGARVVADSNAFGTSKIGILATGPETMIEISGGLLDGNETGLAVLEQARATATEVQIVGGKDCATVDGPGAHLELRGCRIHGAAEVGARAKDRATLVVDGGSIAGCQIGVLGLDPGCQVTVRRAAIHEHTGPAVSIGQHVVGEIEGNDVFDNAFPGIVTVGGRLRAFDNKVHDNRSNGIAIRGGADAVIEGNEIWANALPAITVVGSGTRATVSENSIRDNAGQGIYVYEGASAQVRAKSRDAERPCRDHDLRRWGFRHRRAQHRRGLGRPRAVGQRRGDRNAHPEHCRRCLGGRHLRQRGRERRGARQRRPQRVDRRPHR